MEKTNNDMTYNECDKKFARVKLAIGIISIILSIIIAVEAFFSAGIISFGDSLVKLFGGDPSSHDEIVYGIIFFGWVADFVLLVAAIMCIVTRNSTKEDYSITTASFYWLAAFFNTISICFYYKGFGIFTASGFSIFSVVIFYFGLIIKKKYNLSVRFIWLSSILALGVHLFLSWYS